MAQQLYRRKEGVDCLIMIDTATPTYFKVQQELEIKQKNLKKSAEYEVTDIGGLENTLKCNVEDSKNKILKYKLKPYPGKTVLLKAENNITHNALSPLINYGWPSFAIDLQVVEIPGYHDELFDKKNIATTAEAVYDILYSMVEKRAKF